MSEPFGDNNERFEFSLLLVLSNRLVTLSIALAFLLVRPSFHAISFMFNKIQVCDLLGKNR